MNPPDKCPFCEANCKEGWNPPHDRWFECGTIMPPRHDSRKHQSELCISTERDRLNRQRDALDARVKAAERERDDALAMLGIYVPERDELKARVKELEAYADRLIGSGDRSANLLSCSMGLDETDEWANTHGAHKTRIASDAIADWEKAKETKP